MPDWTFEGKAEMQYIGPRFVPRFANPVEWNANKTYEHLEMVTYYGSTYTSRKAVPAGVQPTNTEYWALTSNYNYQVEQYRQTVEGYKTEMEGKIEQYKNDAAENLSDVQNLLQSEINTKGGFNYGNAATFYVSDINGNDNFNGLTNNTPFKTLEKAISELNTNNRARIIILSEGTYTINKTIRNANFTIELNTNNIQIIPKISSFAVNCAFTITTSNFNITNCVLGQEGQLIYLDYNFASLTNIEVVSSLSGINCIVSLTKCLLNGYTFSNSHISNLGCTYKNNKTPYIIYSDDNKYLHANYSLSFSYCTIRDFYPSDSKEASYVTIVSPNNNLDSICFMYCDNTIVLFDALTNNDITPKYNVGFISTHASAFFASVNNISNFATNKIQAFTLIKVGSENLESSWELPTLPEKMITAKNKSIASNNINNDILTNRKINTHN